LFRCAKKKRNRSVETRASSLSLLCSALGRLLGEHLATRSDWDRWRWVDGVEPETALAVSPTECHVWGVAHWYGDGAWVEPFAATVHLSSDALRLEQYSPRFGDAATGLRQQRAGDRRRQLVRDAAPEWLHTFERRAV
jgi:hypothetical protein